jgi:hypothetical protein
MQIGAGLRAMKLPIGVVHPVELLDESYARAGFYGGTASTVNRQPSNRNCNYEPSPYCRAGLLTVDG